MSIKNKIEIKEQFVASDNTIFDDYNEALEHERFLIRENIYSNRLSVYEYSLYLITSEDELDALQNNPYGEHQFSLPEEIIYPLYLCETAYDDFYHCYWTLDAVIEHEKMLIKALEEVNASDI